MDSLMNKIHCETSAQHLFGLNASDSLPSGAFSPAHFGISECGAAIRTKNTCRCECGSSIQVVPSPVRLWDLTSAQSSNSIARFALKPQAAESQLDAIALIRLKKALKMACPAVKQSANRTAQTRISDFILSSYILSEKEANNWKVMRDSSALNLWYK